MKNSIYSLRLRRMAIVPTALLVVGITTTSAGGERRVHVQGGKMLTRMENGKMVLKGIQGEVGGGKIQMAGNIAADAASNSATVKFEDVRLEKAAALLGKEDLTGWMGDLVVSGFVKGEWEGKGMSAVTRTADGAMVLQTGPGVITDKAILGSIAKATGVTDLPELAYSNIKIQARAKDGHIALDFIRAEGPEFKLESKGKYNASTDKLDVTIDATVSQKLAAKSSYMKLNNVMGFLRGDSQPEQSDEFVEIPRLLVSGELRKPRVGLDTAVTEKVTATAAATKPAAEQKPNVAESVNRVSKFLVSQSAVTGQ
jgi:hypothetical protein